MVPVDMFILVSLHSQYGSTLVLQCECFRFDGFHKQKTEAPIQLAILMFTDFLLDYVQYDIQYLHIVARHLICYMLYL